MTFGSFPKSRKSSLVLALPPSVLAARLQEWDAVGHGEGPCRVPACPGSLQGDKGGTFNGYTTSRLSATWSL